MTEKIDKYEPPPFGHSKPEDFDPVVHIDIESDIESDEEGEAGGAGMIMEENVE